MKTLTVEDGVKNSGLSENLIKAHIEFCCFLKDNGFSLEPETGDDGIGWRIAYMDECVGHTNYAEAGIWIDTCDFGGSGAADDNLKETAWAHARVCEHFSSDEKRCGCGKQPGFSKTIFGKEYKNLCFALLEFLHPGAETLDVIKKLMLLYIKEKNK